MKTVCNLTLLAMASVLAGCATQSADDEAGAEERLPEAGTQACFYRRQGQDFQVLDRRTLIVYAPTRSRPYLVRISPPASELRFANEIAFRSRSNQVCGRAGERLIIGRDEMRRYAVTDVRALEAAELDEILAAYGRGEPGDGLEPQDSAGADIQTIEKSGDE